MKKDYSYLLKLDEADKSILDLLAEENGLTAADILRRGLHLQYRDRLKNEENS